MKKSILAIMAVIATCTIMTGCGKKVNEGGLKENLEKEEELVINEKYDVEKGVEQAIRNTTLNDLKSASRENDGKIDFNDLPGVMYEYMGEITEENITETWIIKMANKDQYPKILKKIRDRLEILRQQYKDVEIVNAIISNDDNIVITQREGIVIAVFAPDAGAIASGIEATIYNQEIGELENQPIEEEARLEEIKNAEE